MSSCEHVSSQRFFCWTIFEDFCTNSDAGWLIQVLDRGELLEFDRPSVLLKNENGLFSNLVAETGRANASVLKRLAVASEK